MTTRPKYLNLVQIRLPLPAFVSIMHRVSGAFLFLALPVLLFWWQTSLASPDTFTAMKSCASSPFAKLALIALLWAYLHHFCAGIRHLAADIDLGTELPSARFASWLVLAVSLSLTAVIGARIW